MHLRIVDYPPLGSQPAPSGKEQQELRGLLDAASDLIRKHNVTFVIDHEVVPPMVPPREPPPVTDTMIALRPDANASAETAVLHVAKRRPDAEPVAIAERWSEGGEP